jgi:hypothetical protein
MSNLPIYEALAKAFASEGVDTVCSAKGRRALEAGSRKG